MKNISRILVFSLSLVAFFQANAQTALRCENVYTQSLKPLRDNRGIVDFNTIADGYVMIGYESEFLFDESAAILRDYAPKEIAAETWRAMSDQEHIAWLKNKFGGKPEFAVDAGLVAINPLPFTPEQVIVDSTGNLEIVMGPTNSYKEWEAMVDLIVGRYGAGSQQAMVSKPWDDAFREARPSVQKTRLVREHLGWLNYTNLRDMFAKMEAGYRRYLKSPDKLTMASFDHPFVGPMNKVKRDVLEQYLNENSFGRLFDVDAVKFVRKNDDSFKYTGGPSYRPDIGKTQRFAVEERNAHKDVNDLKMKVRRDITATLSDMQNYTIFGNVPAFDSVAVFNQLQPDTRQGLSVIFPSKAEPGINYTESELLCLETFRNFALPLMDFGPLASALSVNRTQAGMLDVRIRAAQAAYMADLTATVRAFQAHTISLNEARAKIMGLVGRFANDSGLSTAFDVKAQSLGHEQHLTLNLMLQLKIASMIHTSNLSVAV